jgi:hypothetical protein
MVSLTTSFVRLTQDAGGAHHITVRAGSENVGTTWLGRDALNYTGFLVSGDSAEFHNISPRDIWVMGTNGDFVMWFGDKA